MPKPSSSPRDWPENQPLDGDEWERRMRLNLQRISEAEDALRLARQDMTIMLKQWFVGNKAPATEAAP